jgi:hypothetical protein|uniref:Uncharacterized protein n=1 Tax=virus sp. ctQcs9 TaxID=2825816 RepID=A0A8S5R9Q2_9VIRU|nr:MAG TPA: hypothetical protein [virus sp. ctQcs9]
MLEMIVDVFLMKAYVPKLHGNKSNKWLQSGEILITDLLIS